MQTLLTDQSIALWIRVGILLDPVLVGKDKILLNAHILVEVSVSWMPPALNISSYYNVWVTKSFMQPGYLSNTYSIICI